MSGKRQKLVRARALMGLADLARSRGGDIASLMRQANLKLAILDQPDATVPLEAVARLLERAARALDMTWQAGSSIRLFDGGMVADGVCSGPV